MLPTSIAGSIRISAPVGAGVARLDGAYVGEVALEVAAHLDPAQVGVGLVGPATMPGQVAERLVGQHRRRARPRAR